MRDNQTCAPSKLKDYMTRLSYVSARLGAKPLLEITTDDLEQALSAVKAEHYQSQRTYRETKRHVKRVFQFTLAKHWIVFDPSADLAKVSVKGRVERRSLEASEFARLCACVDRDLASEIEAFEQKELRQMAWGNGFTRSSIKGLASISCLIGVCILCATGCRRGEVLALTWEKVNFHSNEITIDKALNSDGVIKDPKTEAGIRTLSIDPETMSLLKRWKAFQKNALHLVMAKDPTGKKHPVGQNEQTPVVCGCTGSFLDPHNMNRWWGGNAKTAGYRDRAGFPDLKLHELRHTVATLLLGSGMPVIDVATRLGHDDVSVTLTTYGHAIPAHDQKAADLLGSFMSASTVISPHVAEAVRRSA